MAKVTNTTSVSIAPQSLGVHIPPFTTVEVDDSKAASLDVSGGLVVDDEKAASDAAVAKNAGPVATVPVAPGDPNPSVGSAPVASADTPKVDAPAPEAPTVAAPVNVVAPAETPEAPAAPAADPKEGSK